MQRYKIPFTFLPSPLQIQLTPDARGRIDYAFEMIWRKSEWLKDRSDTECVLGLMESVGAARTPVVVSRIRQF